MGKDHWVDQDVDGKIILYRMDLNEMGYESHKWRDLAQGREQWRDLVFAAMSFRVPNA